MFNLFNKSKQKGFTLVELLVVVVVLGILATVTVGILNNSGLRQKARDSQRVADLKKIQTALELYFGQNRQYPAAAASWTDTAAAGFNGVLVPSYLSSLPKDPLNSTDTSKQGCLLMTVAVTSMMYRYTINAARSKYIVGAEMELPQASANQCSSLSNYGVSGIINVGCINAYCYGVQNP